MSEFETFFTGLRQQMMRQYDRSINRDLSQQNWRGLFGRNVRQVLLDIYTEVLQQSEYPMTESAVQALSTLSETLLQYALQKHRSSCALSNFPEEHNPAGDYIAELVQVTQQDWQPVLEKLTTLIAVPAKAME